MELKLVKFEPSAFTIRKNRELLSLLSKQEGYTYEMLKKDAKFLGMCEDCGEEPIENHKHSICNRCYKHLKGE